MAKKGYPRDRDALVARIAELEAERKFGQHGRNIGSGVDVLKHLIRYAAIVLVFFFIYKSIAVLAGQVTFASIGINFLGNVSINEALAWLLGAAGTGYGLHERRVRKNTVARLQPRIVNFERQLDPGRSSSSLTARGDTNPDDI